MSNPIRLEKIAAKKFLITRDPAQQVMVGQQARQVAVATYDVSGAVHSGAIGALTLGVYIPDNAVITTVFIDVVTTFTDGASDAATIAIHAQSANDIVAAIAISNASNVWDAGVRGSKIGYPALGVDAAHDTALEVAALTAASYLKLTAERQLTVTVGTAALTAGKMHIFAEYVVAS